MILNHSLRELLDEKGVLKPILDSMGDGISIQDSNFRILYQNKAFKDLTGDHIGEYCYHAYEQRDHICEGCPVALTFLDGKVHSAVRSGMTAKGLRYVEITTSPLKDESNKIMAGIEIIRDITDRINMERELSESKQMLEDIAHGITESIFLISKDFKILWANKAALQQTGLPMEELIGKYCFGATHNRATPCDSPSDPCPIHELLVTGIPRTEEHVHYDEKGNKLLVEVSAYPVKNGKGETVSFVHITKDVTEKKMLEVEREKLILELQDALSKVKLLSGFLPICVSCKKIRDDKGYWNQIEAYIRERSEAEFSHGICPDCMKKIYPDHFEEKRIDEDES